MKKSELLKLIETIADDGDINEVILGADEFKELGKVDLSKLSTDEFKNLLTTNEAIKGYMTSRDDSIRSSAVETFKSGKMKELIDKAVEEAKNGKKTPEQERIEELEKQFAESQAQIQRQNTINKYTGVLKEKGLPTELVDFVYGDGKEETIDKNIETLGTVFTSAIDSGVKSKLGTSSYVPPNDDATNALDAQIASAMGVK
ncbi:DUF4355 domain-containing protein [Clostridium paraputrificum]|uniref:DUF4355 domain-containing protein n=1 Tax=Clostridium paraputrificum TaxID=29363 RepID=UPI000C086442|nr:DUF4355 domain-containing protein [Clostridium paraputrificum]DAK92436.1 MAG TPA: protein of unknown function (DUF4355) [Bacteriophage sp.]DAU86413.1 MAG TPA: protein of unknown function (DUF4355) [Caudoviricetes sp.]